MASKKLTYQEALVKILSYCAYQERCHKEVREKLYSFGLPKSEVEQLMVELISQNYLSEERFAGAYASGKFRMKHWGRIKIKQHLAQKGVSAACIRIGLQAIDEQEYRSALQRLIEKKMPAFAAHPKELYRVQQYLLGKGFEPELVRELMDEC